MNLTTHVVRVITETGTVLVEIERSGTIARLPERVSMGPELLVGDIAIPTADIAYSATAEGLPAPEPAVVFVVSRVLAAAVPREDLFFPAGDVRDESGTIIGCRYLGRFDHKAQL